MVVHSDRHRIQSVSTPFACVGSSTGGSKLLLMSLVGKYDFMLESPEQELFNKQSACVSHVPLIDMIHISWQG